MKKDSDRWITVIDDSKTQWENSRRILRVTKEYDPVQYSYVPTDIVLKEVLYSGENPYVPKD